MKKTVTALGLLTALSVSTAVQAEQPGYEDMVGTWKWETFTIRVDKCDATGVCAKVVSGPKNVGMQMIQSKLKEADGNFVGKIAHPQTGDTYNSKISMTSNDVWHIDGCTAQNVCASADFKRVD